MSDEYEVYWGDHLVTYIMSNHWGIHQKLVLYVNSNWKIKNYFKKRLSSAIKTKTIKLDQQTPKNGDCGLIPNKW